jgi:hypothetical protein
LQEPKPIDINVQQPEEDNSRNTSPGRFNKSTRTAFGPWWQRSGQRAYEAFQTTTGGITTWFQDYAVNLRIYFGHPVWLPSMALSILHFSVLNYSPTLTVYLLTSGFGLTFLTAAKALSAAAELGSTFFTPWGVRQAGKIWARRENAPLSSGGITLPRGEEGSGLLPEREQDDQEEGEIVFAPQADMGLAVLGLWSLVQMVISLVSFLLTIFSFEPLLNSLGPGLHRPLGCLIHVSLSKR